MVKRRRFSVRWKLNNRSSIPSEVIRDVVRFTRPPGIKGFVVTVKDSIYQYAGRGGWHGITLRLNPKHKYPTRHRPYQRGQLKGRRYYVASLIEMLIWLTAHELIHVKQARTGRHSKRRSKVWGQRGRYSEIETEAWAIRKLREYRKLS